MKNAIFTAIALFAVVIGLAACGGKKKDDAAKTPPPDGKTSATAVYDMGNKTQPDSLKTPAP
jgi:predicted small lipoprotein YifL